MCFFFFKWVVPLFAQQRQASFFFQLQAMQSGKPWCLPPTPLQSLSNATVISPSVTTRSLKNWFPSPAGITRHSSVETWLQRRNKQRPPRSPPRLCSDLEYIRIHSRHLAFPACHLFNFLLKQTSDSCVCIRSQEGCFPFRQLWHPATGERDRRCGHSAKWSQPALCHTAAPFPHFAFGYFHEACFVWCQGGRLK